MEQKNYTADPNQLRIIEEKVVISWSHLLYVGYLLSSNNNNKKRDLWRSPACIRKKKGDSWNYEFEYLKENLNFV